MTSIKLFYYLKIRKDKQLCFIRGSGSEVEVYS